MLNGYYALNLAALMYWARPLLLVDMKIVEIAPKKTLTPDQARIKSLQDQVRRAREAVKAERARQKIRSGQQQLSRIT